MVTKFFNRRFWRSSKTRESEALLHNASWHKKRVILECVNGVFREQVKPSYEFFCCWRKTKVVACGVNWRGERRWNWDEEEQHKRQRHFEEPWRWCHVVVGKSLWQWLWIYSARYLCKLLWLLQLTSLGKKLSMGGLAVSCPFQVAIF